MASSTTRLVQASESLSLEEQGTIARNLITANNLYRVANSAQYNLNERRSSLTQSFDLAVEVLRVSPENHSALSLLGRIKMDEGKLDEAEAFLNQALRFVPRNENTLLNHGYLNIAKKQYDRAEEFFLRALQVNRNSAQAFSGVALCKLRKKDYLCAFNHYRSLIAKGANSLQVRQLLLESAEFLSADYYQPELEQCVIEICEWSDVDLSKLRNLASSLLIHKYHLNDDHALIDMQILEQDQLLLSCLQNFVLHSVPVEGLISEYRKSILTEVYQTQTLRDELLPFAVAIGIYAARTDYAMMMSSDEEQFLVQLINQVKQATSKNSWLIDDIIGALCIIAMYEPLYHQSYSFALLREDLDGWPLGTQTMFQASLYDLSDEHCLNYDLYGQAVGSLVNSELSRAYPRWQHINVYNTTSYHEALAAELGQEVVPSAFNDRPMKLLLLGCGSGQRAIYLAKYFAKIEVTGIDNSPANIAYAIKKAKNLGLQNVEFLVSDTDRPSPELTGNFDVIEFSNDLNNAFDPAAVIEQWQAHLSDSGLMRFSLNTFPKKDTIGLISQLVKSRGLSPTADNIRQLRHAIAQEHESGLWTSLFSNEHFYTGCGCKSLFFRDHNHAYELNQIDDLLVQLSLSFIGFVDLPEQHKALAKELAEPKNLLDWHQLDQEQHIFDTTFEFYCRKINQQH